MDDQTMLAAQEASEKSRIVERATVHIEQLGGRLSDRRKQSLMEMTLPELRQFEMAIGRASSEASARHETVQAIVESRRARENPTPEDDDSAGATTEGS